MTPKHHINISVVIPVLNEAEIIEQSILRVRKVLQGLRTTYEIVVVDDGSSDLTLNKLMELKKDIVQLRIIKLARNVGHMNAIAVGLASAKGSYVVTIDGDMQDPPEKIAEMYQIAKSNHDIDVVQAVRIDRSTDTVFKRTSASIFYRMAVSMTGIPVIPNAADYRLLKRHVVDFLVKLPEKNKVYRLLIPYFGFNVWLIDIKREQRIGGKSKYPLSKMLSLTMNSFISFSTKPLQFFMKIGLLFSGFFLLAALASVWIWWSGVWSFVPGWTSVIFILLMSNSLVIAAIGLVGEYVARTYMQSLDRPSIKHHEIS
jgi:glycosyltransferase involved in cell wall biosynthesis